MGARVLLRIFLRTYVVGATFNTKGMQNVGFALVMEPGLVDLYGHDPAALQRARSRYLKHYNTHPFWTPLLAGIFLSMEKKIASGLLPADILLKLRSTTVYTLSALGDSFFGGSSLVLWSLVGINLAVSGHILPLVLWLFLCFCLLQAFKVYTFARGYAQGLSFLQRLKSWNLIDWGQRIKMANAALIALFVLQIAPGEGFWLLAWAAGASLLAAGSVLRSPARCFWIAVVILVGLFAPWNLVLPLVSM